MASLHFKFGLIILLFLSASMANAETSERHITVIGESEVRVAPDEIILTLGIETFDKDLQTARETNDALVKRTFEIASEKGIPDKYIKTDYINIRPVYDDYPEKNKLLHYQVRKSVVLTIRDIDILESLLTDLISAGVEQVIGIDFRTTDLRNQKNLARSLALKAAREKAAAMAGELDQNIGQVISIRENHSGFYPWSGASWYGWGNRGMSQNVIQNMGGGQLNQGALAPGQISITANVTVSFALE